MSGDSAVTSPPRDLASRLANYRLAWLLAGIAAVLLLTMPKFIYVGDPVTIRMTTIRLLTSGEINVPGEVAHQFGDRGQYFFEHPETHRFYSKYGVLNTLLYAPPLLVEQAVSGRLVPFDELDESGRSLRCLVLNIWNIVIALMLATLLFHTAKLHGASLNAATLFVILVFFGSFLWHYLRAQTVEIFQVTLFTAMYYHLVRYSIATGEGKPRAQVTQAGMAIVWLGLLCLAKLAYVILFPIVIGFILAVTVACEHPAWRSLRWPTVCHMARKHAALLSTISAASLMVLGLILLLNWHRFGSPFSTGYQQFARERSLFRPSLDGYWGYVFDLQKSIFIYCPILVLAFAGLWWLPRGRRGAYACAGVSFLVLYVVSASFVNWRGDWCYGPRYLLFALPVVCLPAASLLSQDWRLGTIRTVLVWGLMVVSLASVNSPLSIHGSDFFSAFLARRCFTTNEDERAVADIKDSPVREYFHQPHWRINRDLRHFRLGHAPFPPLEMQRNQLSPQEFQAKAELLRAVPLGNFYWPGQLTAAPPQEVTRRP